METPIIACTRCGEQRPDDATPCQRCGETPARTVTAPPAPAAAPSVPARYALSGKCAPGGLLALAGITLVGSVLVGMAYHFVTGFFDWLFITPLLFGLATSGPVYLAIKKSRCRSVPLAVVTAIIAGLIVYGTRLLADSQEARPILVQIVSRNLVKFAGMPAADATARAESRLTPIRTLTFYLDLRSIIGATFTSSHSDSGYNIEGPSSSRSVGGSGDMSFRGIWFWIFLLAEAGLVSGIAASQIKTSGMTTPFCETCGEWMRESKPPVARVNVGQARIVDAAVASGDWDRLTATPVVGTVDDLNNCTAKLYRCPRCSSGVLAVSTRSGHNIRQLSRVLVGRDTADQLLERAQTAAP